MVLTELPFGLPGRIFRGVMPYGHYDPEGNGIEEFKEARASGIVLLADDGECMRRARLDLRALYEAEGFEVVHAPVPDFGVPQTPDFDRAVKRAASLAREGESVVVHCYAGIGRTGLFMARLAMMVFDMPGQEAIDWVRGFIPGALENEEQIRFVKGR